MAEQNDWAPEPWRLDDGEVWCADKARCYPVIRHAPDPYIDYDCIDRIIACVNACAGVPTDELELWAITPGYIRKATKVFDAYERSTLGKE